MVTFCSNSSKAKVIVNKSFQVLSLQPPVNVDVAKIRGDFEIYGHSMNQRMNFTFSREVQDIELVNPSNQWIYGLKDSRGQGIPPNDLYAFCPTLSTFSRTDNIHIDGKRIYSNFDEFASEGDASYNNNAGVCTYRVYFPKYKISISDSKRLILERTFDNNPIYEVDCDDSCPEGFCKCPIPDYPGYCCLDCAAVAASIRNITNELRSKNG